MSRQPCADMICEHISSSTATQYTQEQLASIHEQHGCALLVPAAVPDVLQKDLLAPEAAVAESAEQREGVILHLHGLRQYLPDGRLHLLTA